MSYGGDSGAQCACVHALDTRTTPVLDARVHAISRESRACVAGLAETKEAVVRVRPRVEVQAWSGWWWRAGRVRGSVRLARGGNRAAPLASRTDAPFEAAANRVSLSHRRRFEYILDYQRYWIFLLFCSGDRSILNEDCCKVMIGVDSERRSRAGVES